MGAIVRADECEQSCLVRSNRIICLSFDVGRIIAQDTKLVCRGEGLLWDHDGPSESSQPRFQVTS